MSETTETVGAVPAALRDWSVSWPQYTPTDVTPPELLPAALAHHVPDWPEAAPTPADVPDWDRRLAEALVPFRIDWQGRPLNPRGRTGRCGRNLGKWAENSAADPIVVAGYGQERRVLLITRSDIGVEAISGGMVDPGETAPDTLVRELREETGVDLRDRIPVILGRDVVADWRNTDHSWVASTSALFQLDATVTAVGADDALDANWWPFGSIEQLETAITAAGRTLYTAHRPLLQRALDHLARTATTPPASIAELIARPATNLASLTGEPLSETGSDFIDQLREAEERLDGAGVQGGDDLGTAAGLLDQALDVELDGGTQLEQRVFVARAATCCASSRTWPPNTEPWSDPDPAKTDARPLSAPSGAGSGSSGLPSPHSQGDLV
ncbi:NUDIX domain-containing protein [Streptomyces sp. W4I9-2]|uniref:NUDIX domain-containing protein n=1 Tax=Streptomyces sp. W4I9-2 TaxID=3042297 RepID=UPI0027D7DDD3|nr:NUDIX domain-containing protein [Streptomyces sp. W4I9-2]